MAAFYSTTVLGSSTYLLLWFFVAYSFIGVVVESVFYLAAERVLESTSGLLYLPLRPLYGVGGCAMVLLLRPVAAHPVAVFVLGAALATVVEYVASLLTDLAFGAVSWDYSHKRLNVHGRVCLAFSLCWGGLALVALYLVDRPLRALLAAVPRTAGEAVLGVVLTLVLASAVVTVAALARARRRVVDLRAGEGGAPAAAGTRGDRLIDRLVPDRVLINSFPRMTLTTELRQLTGQGRVWIRLPPLSRPGV